MLTLLSPAKTLDFEFSAEGLPSTAPLFQEDIEGLLGRCKRLTVTNLRELMNISQPLAELNRQRFQGDPVNTEQIGFDTLVGPDHVGIYRRDDR